MIKIVDELDNRASFQDANIYKQKTVKYLSDPTSNWAKEVCPLSPNFFSGKGLLVLGWRPKYIVLST